MMASEPPAGALWAGSKNMVLLGELLSDLDHDLVSLISVLGRGQGSELINGVEVVVERCTAPGATIAPERET